MEQAAEIFNLFLDVVRPNSIGDFFIYAIFFLSLIALMPMPDGNDNAQYLLFGVMLLCVLDLMRGDGSDFPIPGADHLGFFTFIIHILMFVFLFITAGVVRSNTKQKAGPVIPLAIVNAFIAVTYAVGAFAIPNQIYAPL